MDKEARCSSQAKREPRFFKIIQPHNLEDGTLEIPPKFVRKYGKCLKRQVFLKAPKGAVQKVELKRSNGRVWLHKGWQDFVHHCSINCWYFLVFGYEGKSFFHVLIFDPSCSEIEYPVADDEIEEDDSVIEILDERVVPMAAQIFNLHQGSGHGVTSARERAFERAKAFLQSPKPHFIVTMGPAYISSNYLHVPIHARSYFYGRGDKGLSFKGPDGRTWLMEYYYVMDRSQPQVRIGLGWREFVQEYDLQVGDACVFELMINISTVMEFNITIFRVEEEEDGRRI